MKKCVLSLLLLISVLACTEKGKYAEKRFPGKIHKPYNSFVGKKGLYLSRTNSFYEGLSEDEVVFDIYRFD
jgi:hypothetical protein